MVAFLDSSHHNDVIMGAMASQNISFTIVYSIVYSDTDQRKHQSSASLASVRRIPCKRASYAENVSIWWRHHVVDVGVIRDKLPQVAELRLAAAPHLKGFIYSTKWENDLQVPFSGFKDTHLFKMNPMHENNDNMWRVIIVVQLVSCTNIWYKNIPL